MANNVKCMLAAGLLPSVLDQLVDLIDTAFTGNDSNSGHATAAFEDDSEPVLQMDEAKLTLLPANVYRTLLQSIRADETIHHNTQYRSTYDDPPDQGTGAIVLSAMAQSLQYVKHRAKRFSTARHCEADSRVIYRTNNRLVLGRIERLFLHKRRCRLDGQYHHSVFAAVRQYIALTDDGAKQDPYRRYAGLRASLICEALSNVVEVIPMRNILAHFVACPYEACDELGRPCMVALPLDQVCVCSCIGRSLTTTLR